MKLLFAMTLMTLGMGARASFASPESYIGVVNKDDGTASIINVSNGKTKTFKVGFLPHEIGVVGGKAYVSNYGSAHVRSSDLGNVPGNTLSVIGLNSVDPIGEISMGPDRCAPHGIAPSRDGRHLYITCEGRQEIAVVETATGKLLRTLPTNQAGSHLLVVSSDESRAYVSNFWLGSVSVIDLVAGKIEKQIFVGRSCEGIALSPDDKTVYVTRVEASEVVKVDTQTLSVVGRLNLGAGSSPIRVVVSPANPGEILVNDVGTGMLKIFNAESLLPIKEIKVGNQPIGLAASATHAYSANMKDKTISAVNLQTRQVDGEFQTGSAPDGMTYFQSSEL